jgi:hypothetical protein
MKPGSGIVPGSISHCCTAVNFASASKAEGRIGHDRRDRGEFPSFPLNHPAIKGRSRGPAFLHHAASVEQGVYHEH